MTTNIEKTWKELVTELRDIRGASYTPVIQSRSDFGGAAQRPDAQLAARTLARLTSIGERLQQLLDQLQGEKKKRNGVINAHEDIHGNFKIFIDNFKRNAGTMTPQQQYNFLVQHIPVDMSHGKNVLELITTSDALMLDKLKRKEAEAERKRRLLDEGKPSLKGAEDLQAEIRISADLDEDVDDMLAAEFDEDVDDLLAAEFAEDSAPPTWLQYNRGGRRMRTRRRKRRGKPNKRQTKKHRKRRTRRRKGKRRRKTNKRN